MATRIATILIGLAFLALAQPGVEAFAQKYGGILKTTIRRNPPSLSINEESTNDTVWCMSPVYNNLVYHDLFAGVESPDTIRPELAEAWRWSGDGRRLTFKLRQGVTWHDGQPFTAKDVKFTFDVIRGVHEQKFKLNPRKVWYFNVTEVTTNGDHEVTFHLARRQPSLLGMLAGGYSPVYPAHVKNVRDLRLTSLGTGPFKLKVFDRDKSIELVKNPDYFVKGRPYLDGVHFAIVKSRATRVAVLQSNQIDIAFPLDTPKPVADTLKESVPQLAFERKVSTSNVNILVNDKDPPFNNLKVRQAINLALERNSLIKSVYGGAGVPGGLMLPPPSGAWGMTPGQLAAAPGFGDAEANRAKARKLLAEAGYGPGNPLRINMSTRGVATYKRPALWTVGELKKVGIEAELEIVDPAQWYSKLARREYQFATNVTANAVDDPDAILYENFKCGSERNYTDYCNKEMEQRFDAQSMETDHAKRLAMARAIDVQMLDDVVRPVLTFRVYYFARWPYVKNFVPSQSMFNKWRMQELWLDR